MNIPEKSTNTKENEYTKAAEVPSDASRLSNSWGQVFGGNNI